ncbi:hypothetical protein M9H77_08554 [Catharanthus roseus]|uniref:Uncharacterized protein n=1 Tax=Catharanthus roseus TaxID=4058 RepID=A0ACC0BYA6_CATRO|nr:hypothetical protein M9H77_08554 [Catharanthus roseus]
MRLFIGPSFTLSLQACIANKPNAPEVDQTQEVTWVSAATVDVPPAGPTTWRLSVPRFSHQARMTSTSSLAIFLR